MICDIDHFAKNPTTSHNFKAKWKVGMAEIEIQHLLGE
jgi:hypothetical protein